MHKQWAEAAAPRHQLMLIGQSLDEALPADHPIRAFEAFLNGLDWRAWETRYNGRRGQPPIHPRASAASSCADEKRSASNGAGSPWPATCAPCLASSKPKAPARSDRGPIRRTAALATRWRRLAPPPCASCAPSGAHHAPPRLIAWRLDGGVKPPYRQITLGARLNQRPRRRESSSVASPQGGLSDGAFIVPWRVDLGSRLRGNDGT